MLFIKIVLSLASASLLAGVGGSMIVVAFELSANVHLSGAVLAWIYGVGYAISVPTMYWFFTFLDKQSRDPKEH